MLLATPEERNEEVEKKGQYGRREATRRARKVKMRESARAKPRENYEK